MKLFLRSTALTMVVAGMSGAALAQSSDYCTQGWIGADTNADGTISADERAAADAGIYSGFDADADGIVSRDEYVDCLSGRSTDGQSAGRTPGDEDSFMAADANGDGIISADEYRMAASGAYEQSMNSEDDSARAERDRWMGSTGADASADVSADEAAARASAHYRSFDEDGDGQVSREEWTGVGDDENAGAGAQGGYFDSMDENMDGQVTLEEFNAARGSAYEAAQGAAEAEGADTSSGVPVYHYRFYTN